MAALSSSGLDEIAEELKKAGEFDNGALIQEILDAGAENVKETWKQVAEAHGFHDSGEMIDSIGFAKEPKDFGGAKAIEIYPQGKDSKTGVRNAEKAFYLHYGWSDYDATHWVDEAEQKAEAPATEAMKAVWEQKMKGK